MHTVKISVRKLPNCHDEYVALINGANATITSKANLVNGIILPLGTVKGSFKFHYDSNLKKQFGDVVNFCIIVGGQKYYGKVNLIDHLRILTKLGGLWVHKSKNIKWLLTLFARMVEIFVAIKISLR